MLFQCRSRDDWSDGECAVAAAGMMSTVNCCCCCGARSAPSRCCVDYSRLTEPQRQSTPEHRPCGSTDAPSSPVDVQCLSIPSPYIDVQPSPMIHDDDDDDADEVVVDAIYDRASSSASRPTVLRLTTFKPSLLQPPPPTARRPRRETVTEDEVVSTDQTQDERNSQSSGVDVNCPITKQLHTTSTTSSISVVSTTASAVLERLQPDLLPLVSSSTVAQDSSIVNAVAHGPDDLP